MHQNLVTLPNFIKQSIKPAKTKHVMTVIIGYIKTLIAYTGRLSKSQINNETSALNNSMGHVIPSGTYRTVHSTYGKYTFFLEYGKFY